MLRPGDRQKRHSHEELVVARDRRNVTYGGRVSMATHRFTSPSLSSLLTPYPPAYPGPTRRPPVNIMATSSPDSGFVPRKEFIREHRDTANTFALMAISSSNLIRLYSFPISVVNSLRRMYDQGGLLSCFREDITQNCCEFAMEGKPWSVPKNVYTEKLLLDTISLICQAGYSYLSTIDYGREPDDRLAVTFSKPCALRSSSRRSGSPVPASPSGDNSGSNYHERFSSRKCLFALSFASATALRVINPPLHSTPAILQAVRNSWPRGVTSEKKVADNTYEFKLKGYKWFQEDTFATDSLRHILTLLSSLDAHSFSLMTSLSLTNRSRVKDLWIFTGVLDESSPMPESPVPSILDSSPDLKKLSYIPSQPAPAIVGVHHRRYVTAPNVSTASHTVHDRAMKDNFASHPHHLSPHIPSPSFSSPGFSSSGSPNTMLHSPNEPPHLPEAYRAVLPSNVSDNTPNMTGIGTPRYSPSTPPSPPFDGQAPDSPPPVLQSALSRRKSPSPLELSQSALQAVPSPQRTAAPPYAAKGTTLDDSVPLLSPGVFRDSAFSSLETGDPPAQWNSDPLSDPQEQARSLFVSSKLAAVPPVRAPAGALVPEAWQASPVEEKDEDEPQVMTAPLVAAHILEPHVLQSPGRPVQDVRSFVEAPEFRSADHRSRKSEAGLVGLIASNRAQTPPLPAIPASPQSPTTPSKGKRKDSNPSGSGQGWVLVNVDKDSQHTPVSAGPSNHRSLHPTDHSNVFPAPHSPSGPASPHAIRGGLTPRQGGVEHGSSMSPAAKTVVIIDALETKNKARADGGTEDSTMKRLFSLTRKTSHRKIGAAQAKPVDSARSPDLKEQAQEPAKIKKQRGVLHKLRIATPEAPRKEDARRSYD